MLQVKTKIHATVLTGIIALVFVFMSIIIYLFYYRAHEKTLDFDAKTIDQMEYENLVQDRENILNLKSPDYINTFLENIMHHSLVVHGGRLGLLLPMPKSSAVSLVVAKLIPFLGALFN